MLYSEYLSLNITASKGCVNAGSPQEMAWNNVRLLVTQNGVTSVHTLVGGLENLEEHLNHQLTRYKEQGWEPIKVERPQEKSQTRFPKNAIHCLLKRSVSLQPKNHFNQLGKHAAKIRQHLSISA